MFIKKDLRKIDAILNDADDDRKTLKLAKRAPEFDSTINVLTRESKLEALKDVESLSLYDNSLTTIDGIGSLAHAPLEELNVGCNKLTTLPLDLGKLTSLKRIWLEDNEFDEFPLSLSQVPSLESIKLGGNKLTVLPANLSSLRNLVTLACENNMIEAFPLGIFDLESLRFLWLRQNRLVELPEKISDLNNLEVLSLSSNRLKTLPDSLANMSQLKKLYVNGNSIEEVSSDLTLLVDMTELNIANNNITEIPDTWTDIWGDFDKASGKLVGGSRKGVSVTVMGNPAVKPIKDTPNKHM